MHRCAEWDYVETLFSYTNFLSPGIGQESNPMIPAGFSTAPHGARIVLQ